MFLRLIHYIGSAMRTELPLLQYLVRAYVASKLLTTFSIHALMKFIVLLEVTRRPVVWQIFSDVCNSVLEIKQTGSN
jgi:hypothetical protein